MGDECLTEGCDRTPVSQGLCKHHCVQLVRVPAEKIAALREAFRVEFRRTTSYGASSGLSVWDAARAVVDAVETEDEPQHEYEFGRHLDSECRLCNTPAPSPARDDAEKAIAGLLPDHQPRWGIQYDGKGGVAHPEDGGIRCFCGWESGPSDGLRPWPKFWGHVASVIAAQMAAPDELTALRADREILNELTALADVWREYAERPDCADSLTYRAASDWIMHILAGNSHAALPYFLGDALTEGDA